MRLRVGSCDAAGAPTCGRKRRLFEDFLHFLHPSSLSFNVPSRKRVSVRDARGAGSHTYRGTRKMLLGGKARNLLQPVYPPLAPSSRPTTTTAATISQQHPSLHPSSLHRARSGRGSKPVGLHSSVAVSERQGTAKQRAEERRRRRQVYRRPGIAYPVARGIVARNISRLISCALLYHIYIYIYIEETP